VSCRHLGAEPLVRLAVVTVMGRGDPTPAAPGAVQVRVLNATNRAGSAHHVAVAVPFVAGLTGSSYACLS
jgi:hypothetical protein